MLTLREYIDLIIPRGSARLINNAVNKATVPILQTGTGNCHVCSRRSPTATWSCTATSRPRATPRA